MSNELEQLREQLDSINEQLLGLINQRAEIAQEIGKVKINRASIALIRSGSVRCWMN